MLEGMKVLLMLLVLMLSNVDVNVEKIVEKRGRTPNI
jgi:hypothetical protein